ncbi:MAG: hypothetical protein ACUVTM_07170 [Candidatus Bathyarchaeia archaeon]
MEEHVTYHRGILAESKISKERIKRAGVLMEEADRIAEEVKERVSRETGCQHCMIHVDPASNSVKQNLRK